MLTLLLVGCVVGAIALAAYSVWLVRKRRPEPSEAAPAPTPLPPVVPKPQRALPGMPPRHDPPVPSTWSAVDRNLDAPRRAPRGSAPPRQVGGNRFDDVLTAGLPVVPASNDHTDHTD